MKDLLDLVPKPVAEDVVLKLPPTSSPNRIADKQHIAQYLSQALSDRGWNQSDLARRAGLARELVSTYIRGVSVPNARSLKALANALGVPVGNLIAPRLAGSGMNPTPAFSITEISGRPNEVWLQVNRSVSSAIAVKVLQLLNSDGK